MILSSLLCLALVVYHEARGVTFEEQVLVSRSVITRAEDKHISYCSTAFQPSQYSWTRNYKYKAKFKNADEFYKYYNINEYQAFLTSVIAANEAILFNKTEVRHFYTPSRENPSWAKNKKIIYKSSNFVFFKD